MIRLLIGFFMVMGAVGGLEMDTATWTEFFITAGIGLSLMAWAVVRPSRSMMENM